MSRLTWAELAALKLGACIRFEEPHNIWTSWGTVEVPAGTVCTIEEQGLDEVWGGLIVRPIDKAIQATLVFHQEKHNGCVMVNGIADVHEPSPFILDDSCPVECI